MIDDVLEQEAPLFDEEAFATIIPSPVQYERDRTPGNETMATLYHELGKRGFNCEADVGEDGKYRVRVATGLEPKYE